MIQRGLPIIPSTSLDVLQERTISTKEPLEQAIMKEMALLIENDSLPSKASKLKRLNDDLLSQARAEIQKEMPFEIPAPLPDDWEPLTSAIFPSLYNSVESLAEKNNTIEKKLALHLGGYQQRAKALRQKISEAAEALQATKLRVETSKTAQIAEEATVASRMDHLRDEVTAVNRREREAQEVYRAQKEELESLGTPLTNGVH